MKKYILIPLILFIACPVAFGWRYGSTWKNTGDLEVDRLYAQSASIRGDLEVDGKIYGDGSALTGISASSGGDHATMSNLSYASSGHTGFQPAGTYLSGSGNKGYVMLWGSSTVGTDSAIYQNGSNIGIGTTTPMAGLQVGAGNKSLSATLGGTSVLIKGNLEVDGKLYGDGSAITNLSISSSLANPTSTIGLTAVNGSASTGMRSDGAPALSQGISPTWTGNHIFAPASGNTIFQAGNVGIGTATAGIAGLQVGSGNQGIPTAALGTSSALIRGNLEVDGKLYGDGSYITNISISSALANPTGTIGLTAVNGSAVTGIRSDGAPALSQAISPTWTGNHAFTPASGGTTFPQGNVGIGTTAVSVAGLQVGTGNHTLPATLGINSALIRGNLEVDGKIYGDGSGITNLPAGVSGANPSASIGLTRIDGSASTFMRSDASPALSQGIAPTWTGVHTFNNTTIMGANLGIGTTAPQRSLEVDGGVYVRGANVGIGTVNPIAGLQVGGGTSALSVPHAPNSVLVKGNLEVDGSVYGDGSKLLGISDGGSGFVLTANKIPKAATTTSLGDSAAYSVGNNIGIGTSTPVAGLHVGTGAGSLGATLTSTGALIRGNLEVDGTITGTVNVASDAKRSTYIGTDALKNHNAYDSTAFGYRAQYTAGAGYYNDAVGSYALYSNGTAYYNEAIGYKSLYSSTGGEKNVCIGYQCGYTISSGDSNIMAGYNTGYYTTSGSYNVSLGEVSLYQNTDGSYNTALGFGAMSYGSSPDYSVGIGYYALYYSTGQQNVAIGLGSMETMTTGDYNTAVGSHTGRYIDGGTNNVFMGNNAGTYLNNGTDYNITSTYSVYIGNASRAYANNETNAVVIAGTTGLGLGSNTTVLGNSSTTITYLPGGNLGIGTSAPRQKLEVNGTIRATGYQSSDGTAGATVTTCTGFKNGLCVSGT